MHVVLYGLICGTDLSYWITCDVLLSTMMMTLVVILQHFLPQNHLYLPVVSSIAIIPIIYIFIFNCSSVCN